MRTMSIATLMQATIPVWKVVGAVILGILLLIFLFVFLRYANLFVRAYLTKAGVNMLDMVTMSLVRVNPTTIVNARVNLVKARIEGVERRDLEAHYLAGGNV